MDIGEVFIRSRLIVLFQNEGDGDERGEMGMQRQFKRSHYLKWKCYSHPQNCQFPPSLINETLIQSIACP